MEPSVIFAALIAMSCYAFNQSIEAQRAAAPRQTATIERRVDLSNLSTLKRTAQPVSSSRPANVTWQKAKLPQHRRTYSLYDFATPHNCLEGGVAQYHNLRLIGHKDAVQAITKALNEVWADSEARAVAEAKTRDIYCIKLENRNGLAYHGAVAIDPFRQDITRTAGTIYHELLHGEDNEDREHQWIYPKQNAFVARRQRG